MRNLGSTHKKNISRLDPTKITRYGKILGSLIGYDISHCIHIPKKILCPYLSHQRDLHTIYI